MPDPDTGYIRSVKTGSGLSCRISECAGYRIKPDTGYRIFKYSKCYKYYRTISFQMIMASNGGDNGGIDPPEDLYLVPSLGIERSKNTDLFNFNGKNHVQTPVSRANCVLKGGAKKICVVWWTLVKTMKYFFVNFINNLLVISFLITECRQCRHQYKNLLKWKTIWGWCHITQYSREADTMN